MRLGRVLYPIQARDWLFPADSVSGHLVEHKEDRKTLDKWGNELRQTYRTVAQTAGIADLDVLLLMNHSVPGVNVGYITRSKLLGDHLQRQQETISAKIAYVSQTKVKDRTLESKEWPFLSSRRLLKEILQATESDAK
jgi:hypothetical protein